MQFFIIIIRRASEASKILSFNKVSEKQVRLCESATAVATDLGSELGSILTKFGSQVFLAQNFGRVLRPL